MLTYQQPYSWSRIQGRHKQKDCRAVLKMDVRLYMGAVLSSIEKTFCRIHPLFGLPEILRVTHMVARMIRPYPRPDQGKPEWTATGSCAKWRAQGALVSNRLKALCASSIRGSKDHITMRILHSGSKAQDKKVPETMVWRVFMCTWSLGL